MAEKAGTSIGTVSRVMNGEGSVSLDLRRRVLIAARRIGFVPRTSYRHLAVLTGRQNPLFPVGYTSIMSSLIERFASRRGLGVEVVDMDNMDLVYECRIEAAIGVVFDDRIVELADIPNLPVVAINHPMAAHGIHSIYTDHREQGVLATRHLVESGHRRIAFLADLPDEWGARERMAGYRSVLEAHGVAFDPGLVRFGSSDALYDILQRWIRGGVTAILNLSEDSVPEVLHILSNVLRLRIGRDISTVTLEDLPLYQYFTPPQTVIRQPLEEIARQAVEHALTLSAARREGRSAEGTLDLCLHGELVERDSVADVPGAAVPGGMSVERARRRDRKGRGV